MKTTSAISISMPTPMLKKAEELAKKENRTMSEFLRETLRRYIEAKQGWAEISSYGRQRARELGIKPKDVDRLIHQARKEGRAAAEKNEKNRA